MVLAGKFACCAFTFAAVKAPRTNIPAREATTTAAILETCLYLHCTFKVFRNKILNQIYIVSLHGSLILHNNAICVYTINHLS